MLITSDMTDTQRNHIHRKREAACYGHESPTGNWEPRTPGTPQDDFAAMLLSVWDGTGKGQPTMDREYGEGIARVRAILEGFALHA